MKGKLFKIFGVLAISAACLTPAHSSAAGESMYVQADIHYVMLNDSDIGFSGIFAGNAKGKASYDDGAGFGVALGYDFGNRFRAEGELVVRNNEAEANLVTIPAGATARVDGDFDTTALMINGYYDIPVGEKTEFYLGAGFGGAAHDSENEVAYQGMVGAAYNIKQDMDLIVGYRYFATDDFEKGGVSLSYDAHNIHVGLRFGF